MNALSIKDFSKNLYRPSKLTADGAPVANTLRSLADVQAETPAENNFLSAARASRINETPPANGNHQAPGSRTRTRGQDAVDGLVSSLRKSSQALESDLGNRPLSDFQPMSPEALSALKHVNPIAHDRFLAVPEASRQKVRAIGSPESITFLIPESSTTQPAFNKAQNHGASQGFQIEEIFRSERLPNGPTNFSGRRNHNGEWYHFQGQAATPPQSAGKGRAPVASAAVTNFAPERLLASNTPESLTEFYGDRVPSDTRGITEGPWKPFLQGPTLRGSDHKVQGAKSGQNGFEAFTSTFDSVLGALKNVQDLAAGIKKAADFLGIAGELGQFGDLLGWIGALNLPKSPADFINSILLGKGIVPGAAPPASVADHSGSGVDGCVVTQCGAYANALGEGLIDTLGVQESGAGPDATGGEAKDEKIGGTTTTESDAPAENQDSEAEAEAEKAAAEKAEAKVADEEDIPYGPGHPAYISPEELDQMTRERIDEIDKQLENEDLSPEERQRLLNTRRGWERELLEPPIEPQITIQHPEELPGLPDPAPPDEESQNESPSHDEELRRASSLEAAAQKKKNTADVWALVDSEKAEQLRNEAKQLELEAARIREGEKGVQDKQRQHEAGDAMRDFTESVLDELELPGGKLPNAIKDAAGKIVIAGIDDVTEAVIETEQDFNDWLRETELGKKLRNSEWAKNIRDWLKR